MEKFLMSIGGVLVALVIGFLIAFELVAGLHQAFITGGYLWTILGAGTMIFGYKVKGKSQQSYMSVV